jgi:c-di-GMP-binding flagellar brake protein YcgR
MTELSINTTRILRVGQLIKLRFESSSPLAESDVKKEELTYSSRIEDVLLDQIVVSWPTSRGVRAPVENEQKVSLHVNCEQGMFRLESWVVDRRTFPVPVLHVFRYGDWSRSQLRDYVRLAVTVVPQEVFLLPRPGVVSEVPADGEGEAEPQPERIDAIIRDLSAGGMRLASAKKFQIGDVIRIRFPLGPGQPDISAEAMVVWVAEEDAKQKGIRHRFKAGCRFLNLGMRDQDCITRFIFNKQASLRRCGLL